jgi:deoxyribodipyrimidine photo-lyase
VSQPILLWLRNDLRLHDHPALTAAGASAVVPVYVLDDATPGAWARGGASRWWLHHSLDAYRESVANYGGRLVLRRGNAAEIITDLARTLHVRAVHCSRAFEPWAASQERELYGLLAEAGIELKRFPGVLLHDPDEVRTKAGAPFKVYTPFWRNVSASPVRQPKPQPAALKFDNHDIPGDTLDDWRLLPHAPDWAGGLRQTWQPGERSARDRLAKFIDGSGARYKEQRDRPDLAGTSRLSPHLHFGEISPATCWHAAQAAALRDPSAAAGLETFRKELVWRDFAYHLLHHWPDLPTAPFREQFAHFPWADDTAASRANLIAWQRGQTGYPIVDAGMRELWATGWMHNRVRMIVASFLTKHLRIPWQAGEAWFWDCLTDADLASNAASWQWVAGSGADAAPYFRIFNPITQGQKFDPEGSYVRRWVPELSGLSNACIHAPWTCPPSELTAAKVELGATYPHPIVDHAQARADALAAYEKIKTAPH